MNARLRRGAVRLFTIIPVAVLAVSLAVGAVAVVAESRSAAARARATAEPVTGMDILNAYACARGETKKILIRGVEDDFSPAGEEPGLIREGRNSGLPMQRQGAGHYDQVNMDRPILDSFRIAGPYSRGLLLFRARPLGDNGNDSFSFGSYSVNDPSGRLGPRNGVTLARIRNEAGWTTVGDIHHAELEDLFLNRNYPVLPRPDAPPPPSSDSLLSYLNEPDGSGWLDIAVQDDTTVDFIGLALCSPPAVKRGVTLANFRPSNLDIPGVVRLTCHPGSAAHACDPYVGDTVCSAMLPVACLRPGDAPAPTDEEGRLAIPTWSGGTIAATEPVAGTRFRSVRDVDAFCGRRFGAGWRAAAIHDGLRSQSIAGQGDSRTINGRVWVDIVDQPHATCWARQ